MGKLTGFFVPDRGRAYFLAGDQYVRYDVRTRTVDPGYPKPITKGWRGAFDRDVDAALLRPAGDFAYFFRGIEYVKIDQRTNTVLPGYPKPIAPNWPGLFDKDLDAAVPAPDGVHAYFFRGAEYLKYDLAANRALAGYPKLIASAWVGMFDEVDTVLACPDGFASVFRGADCVVHDLRTNLPVGGYPQPIAAEWPGLGKSLDPGSGTSVTAKDAFRSFITPFEGRVPWMYLDTKALVTVGIGNLIDPERYALELPFVRKGTVAAATRNEISAEWRRVKADTSLATRGHRAAERITGLRLTEAFMDELLRTRLEANEVTLRKTFPGWDGWPADAQLGVHSLAWAMGPGFPRKYLRFTAAALRQDWRTAAAECRISGAREHRNIAHEVLFHNAAAVVARGLDRTGVRYPDEL